MADGRSADFPLPEEPSEERSQAWRAAAWASDEDAPIDPLSVALSDFTDAADSQEATEEPRGRRRGRRRARGITLGRDAEAPNPTVPAEWLPTDSVSAIGADGPAPDPLAILRDAITEDEGGQAPPATSSYPTVGSEETGTEESGTAKTGTAKADDGKVDGKVDPEVMPPALVELAAQSEDPVPLEPRRRGTFARRRAEPAKPEPAEPEPAVPEAAVPDAAVPDAAVPEPAQPEADTGVSAPSRFAAFEPEPGAPPQTGSDSAKDTAPLSKPRLDFTYEEATPEPFADPVAAAAAFSFTPDEPVADRSEPARQSGLYEWDEPDQDDESQEDEESSGPLRAARRWLPRRSRRKHSAVDEADKTEPEVGVTAEGSATAAEDGPVDAPAAEAEPPAVAQTASPADLLAGYTSAATTQAQEWALADPAAEETAGAYAEGGAGAEYADSGYATYEQAAYAGTEEPGYGYDQAGWSENDPSAQYWSGDGYAGYEQGAYAEGADYVSYGGAGEEQTDYEQAGYDQAAYGRAAYGQAGYDQAGYDQAGYDQAGYDQAGYDQAGYDQAAYDQAAYDPAAYGQAGYEQAGYEQAGYEQAGEGWAQAPQGWSGESGTGWDESAWPGSQPEGEAAYLADAAQYGVAESPESAGAADAAAWSDGVWGPSTTAADSAAAVGGWSEGSTTAPFGAGAEDEPETPTGSAAAAEPVELYEPEPYGSAPQIAGQDESEPVSDATAAPSVDTDQELAAHADATSAEGLVTGLHLEPELMAPSAAEPVAGEPITEVEATAVASTEPEGIEPGAETATPAVASEPEQPTELPETTGTAASATPPDEPAAFPEPAPPAPQPTRPAPQSDPRPQPRPQPRPRSDLLDDDFLFDEPALLEDALIPTAPPQPRQAPRDLLDEPAPEPTEPTDTGAGALAPPRDSSAPGPAPTPESTAPPTKPEPPASPSDAPTTRPGSATDQAPAVEAPLPEPPAAEAAAADAPAVEAPAAPPQDGAPSTTAPEGRNAPAEPAPDDEPAPEAAPKSAGRKHASDERAEPPGDGGTSIGPRFTVVGAAAAIAAARAVGTRHKERTDHGSTPTTDLSPTPVLDRQQPGDHPQTTRSEAERAPSTVEVRTSAPARHATLPPPAVEPAPAPQAPTQRAPQAPAQRSPQAPAERAPQAPAQRAPMDAAPSRPAPIELAPIILPAAATVTRAASPEAEKDTAETTESPSEEKADEDVVPDFVEYRSSEATRLVLGGLFTVFAVGAVMAIIFSVGHGTTVSILLAISLTLLAMACWWGLLSWSPTIVSISHGVLEVARGPSGERFDLRQPDTHVVVGDNPRSRDWTTEVTRDSGTKVVIRHGQVRAREFSKIVLHHRRAAIADRMKAGQRHLG